MMIATLIAALFTATAPLAEPATQATTPVVTTPRVKRYCIVDRREGSRQRGKICRTRDEWRARGFDPVLVLARG
ncbi:hypothetical protein [Sphingomonas sp. Leaf62]|uniref:hypothetical protein n=1 Tax=Sphingomonas sp. Leaf62 TaxID=1736228 RepID=UPI0006F6F6BD|nr:hypothetical protein [Sphingomonas sp. Leaf62]KQN71041.1 hypothetical protein ASE91_07805 [Sphingomonas sp. Leaf62]